VQANVLNGHRARPSAAGIAKAAALIGALVIVSRWPFRSHALFSWDSANFAMALDRIDIAMHRPHPPGYLGYVFVARILRHVFPDANTALVVWNWIATALAALTTAAIAIEVGDTERRWMTATAATAIVLTSPLAWFYGEVAEIYPSELLCAALVGYAAVRAARGHDNAIYAAVAALALTAAFKVVTAFLMFPAVAFAWTCVSPTARRRSLSLVALAAAVMVVAFLVVQPDLWTVATRLVRSSDWLTWFPKTDRANLLRVLNRNLRNTLTAAIVSVGLINIAALAVWAIRDRTLPPGLNRCVAWWWALPILLFCVVLVIAKPGYLLPFVPLAAIVIGWFYTRFTPPVAAALVLAQAIVNVAHFLWLSPLSTAVTGGDGSYRDKPVWQRMASDLQPLTFPTRFTIYQSDQRVRELLTAAAESCPHERNVIVVDTAPVAGRRVMFYLPDAAAIHSGPSGIDFLGHRTDFVAVPQEGTDLVATCRVIWLTPDEGPGGVALPAGTPRTRISHLGWTTDAATLHVTPASISFR
jgi:4-amino-4-deoxy-L-arabinose transferase-like glycosyltransferase